MKIDEKMHAKNQWHFKTIFSRFWEGFGIPGFECWASFWLQKSIFFTLFLKLPLFIDFKAFWEGLGRILGRFGERLGRVWENLGRVLEVFREGLGRIWGDATDQNEVGPADRAQRLNKRFQLKMKGIQLKMKGI